MLNGRKRFKACVIPETVTDSKVLEILLYSSERAWASAVELKSAAATSEEPSGALEYHSKRRFYKAYKYASQLADLASRSADERTAEECRVYKDISFAEFLVESGSFTEAAIPLNRAREGLTKLSVLTGGSEPAYQSRIASLEPLIRVIRFNTSNKEFSHTQMSSVILEEQTRNSLESTKMSEISSYVDICEKSIDKSSTKNEFLKEGFNAAIAMENSSNFLQLLGSSNSTFISGLSNLGRALKILFSASALESTRPVEALAVLREIDLEISSHPLWDTLVPKISHCAQILRVRLLAELVGRFSVCDIDQESAMDVDEVSPMSSAKSAASPRQVSAPSGIVGKLTGWFTRK